MQRSLVVISLVGIFSFFPFLAYADCPVINRTLKLGSKGEDVRQLQAFLESQGAFTEGDGVFGQKTREAVEFWQNSVGIMPMGGIFDADSRKALSQSCEDVSTLSVKSEVSVKPSEGFGPLVVSVTTKAPAGDQFEYTLDLGDGTTPIIYACKANQPCKETYVLKHRFALPGVYKVQLFRGYGQSDLSVKVGGSQSKAVVSHTLVTVQKKNPEQAPELCREWFDGCVVCTRTKKGEALTCPKHACYGAYQQPKCRSNIRVNKVPSVKVTGQSTFVTDISRPFKITAQDPENTAMVYGFDWGETGTPKIPTKFTKAAAQSHIYKKAGVYTITGYAKDAEGGIGRGLLKVQVRDSYEEETCPRTYEPVCGVTADNVQKNYTNECMMRHDHAQKVRGGGC